jgi:hypothetical protein
MRVCLVTVRRSMIQYLGDVGVEVEAKESNIKGQDDECIESPKFLMNLLDFNFFAPSSAMLGIVLALSWP